MTALESLGDLLLEAILPNLDPRNAAVFACVSTRCRAAATDDRIWHNYCVSELDLDEPVDPDGVVCPSFKVAYQRWHDSFHMYPMSLVRRAKKCWGEIKEWMVANIPEVGSTLQKGASEVEITEAENKLGVNLPLPTKLLYRFCNGQNTLLNYSNETSYLATRGVIGGYLFYDHMVNVHLFPLNLMVKAFTDYATLLRFVRREYVVVAVSCYAEKLFFLNCTNGQLYVGTNNLQRKGEMLPCVPYELIKLEHNADRGPQQDALLLWLEEHCRRLKDGRIQIRELYKRRMLSLYPELPPFCSTAVTNGVQIRAYAILVPELCDLGGVQEKFYFSYSVRMSLLPGGGLLDGMHFSSCQLTTRHWIIRANDDVVSDVRGEAVIGKFPLLIAGKPEFVYESCTPLPSSPGSVEGSFTFLPGRIVAPQGREFEVEVALFPLEVPGYIY